MNKKLFLILIILVLMTLNINFSNAGTSVECEDVVTSVFTSSYNCGKACNYIEDCSCEMVPSQKCTYDGGPYNWCDLEGQLFFSDDCGTCENTLGCTCVDDATPVYQCQGPANFCANEYDGSYCNGNTKLTCYNKNIVPGSSTYCPCGCEESTGGGGTAKGTYASCISCCGNGECDNGETYETCPKDCTQNFCLGTLPNGATKCLNDDIYLTTNLTWEYVGSSSTSCTSRKCEYYYLGCPDKTTLQVWNPAQIALPCDYCNDNNCSYCGDGTRNIYKYGAIVVSQAGASSSLCDYSSDCINGWRYWCACRGSGCPGGSVWEGEIAEDNSVSPKLTAETWYNMKMKCDSCSADGACLDNYVEQCDDGNTITEKCAYGLTSCEVCNSGCTKIAGETSYCGDGKIDSTYEQCDDSNKNSGDGCSATCKFECTATIPDGAMMCENDNISLTSSLAWNNAGTSSTSCTLRKCEYYYNPTCGNGIKDEGEECDDGDLDNTNRCTTECKFARCGDNYTQNFWYLNISDWFHYEENCDSGINNADENQVWSLNQVCNYDCSGYIDNYCGDGEIFTGGLTPPVEECDPDTYGCVACQFNNTCTDSDGDSIYVKGQLSGIRNLRPFPPIPPGTAFTDYCLDSKNLREYSCIINEISYESKICPTFCTNGYCVNDCASNLFPNYQKTGYTGNPLTYDSNDEPLRIDDTSINSCCPNQNDCVMEIFGSGSCANEDYPWDYYGDKIITHVCDDGKWVDLDSTQTACEKGSHTWAPGGIENIQTYHDLGTTNSAEFPVGEYNELGEMECCGDDGNESLITTDCYGNILTTPVCCPADYYKVIGGQCVLSDSCPSLEKTAKVVTDVPSGMEGEDLAEVLQQQDPNLGCYDVDTCSKLIVDLSPINIPSPTPTQICDEEPSCVFKSKTNKDISGIRIYSCEEAEVCINSPVCKEVVSDLPFEEKADLVLYDENTNQIYDGLISYNSDGFKIQKTSEMCYRIPPINCIPSSSCKAKIITKIDSGTCFPACLKNTNDVGSCIIACKDITLREYKIFDGPNCEFVDLAQDKICDVTQFERVCVNNYEIVEYNSDGDIDVDLKSVPCINDCPPGEQYYTMNSYCSEQEFCEDLGCVEEAICLTPEVENMYNLKVPQTMKIYDYNGELYNTLQCDKDVDDLSEFGEYWCPEGYKIEEDDVTKELICIKDYAVCAVGYTGSITPSCDTLFTPKDDYWNLYDDVCFEDTLTTNIYDVACCLDIVLNDNFNIYQETKVKIY